MPHRGLLLLGQQRLDESISSFKNAINFRPKLAGTHTHPLIYRIPQWISHKIFIFISRARKPRRCSGTGEACRRGARGVSERRAPRRPRAERSQISRERQDFGALSFGAAAAGAGAAAARASLLAAGQGSDAHPLPATGVCFLISFLSLNLSPIERINFIKVGRMQIDEESALCGDVDSILMCLIAERLQSARRGVQPTGSTRRGWTLAAGVARLQTRSHPCALELRQNSRCKCKFAFFQLEWVKVRALVISGVLMQVPTKRLLSGEKWERVGIKCWWLLRKYWLCHSAQEAIQKGNEALSTHKLFFLSVRLFIDICWARRGINISRFFHSHRRAQISREPQRNAIDE